MLSSLFSKMVRDHISELAYPAVQAGFTLDFGANVDGFDFRANGYSSGILNFVQHMARYLQMINEKDKNSKKGKVVHASIKPWHVHSN